MRMKSGIEDQSSGPAEGRPDGTAEPPSRALLDAVSNRAERAEERAAALETENRQLRSERTKIALAAARTEAASPEFTSRRAEQAEAGALALAAENRQLRSARVESTLAAEQAGPGSFETAFRRAELAEARALALEAENQQLRTERAHAVVAAARAEHALQENRPLSRDELEQSPESPMAELRSDDAVLRAAALEREAAVRTVEASLRKELSQRIDAMRHSHAAELEARSQEDKKRFAEEIMSAMSAADATWRKDTEARIRKARERAGDALARAEAMWRLRSRIAVLRVALVWRARERHRLADAKRHWEATHRDTIEACNRRWQAKLDRLTATVRRPQWRPDFQRNWRPNWRLWVWRPKTWQPKAWRPEAWRIGMARVFAFAKLDPPTERRAAGVPAPGQARLADAGFVAATLVFMALYLPPTAPFSAADAEPIAVAAAATTQAKTSPQVAKLQPGAAGHGLASDGRRNAPAKAKQEPGPRPKGKVSRPARQGEGKRDTSASPLPTPAKPAAGPAGNRPGEQMTENEQRLRLLEKIRRLRAELSPR